MRKDDMRIAVYFGGQNLEKVKHVLQHQKLRNGIPSQTSMLGIGLLQVDVSSSVSNIVGLCKYMSNNTAFIRTFLSPWLWAHGLLPPPCPTETETKTMHPPFKKNY